MRRLTRAGVIVGMLLATAGLAGCGSTGGSLLTTGAATQLTSDLNQASRALGQYNCEVAAAALTSYRNDVSQLQGVNTTLTKILAQGATTINTLAQQRCPTGNPVTSTRTQTTTTNTGTRTTGTHTTTTETNTDTVGSASTTTVTSTGSGGVPPSTNTTPAPTTTTGPNVTTPTVPASPPDSGGAGLGGTSTDGTGGTGVGGGGGQ